MSAFDLFPTALAAERGQPVDLNAGAGFFEGSLTAPLKGVGAAATGLARGLNLALSTIPGAVDEAFGTNYRDAWFENMMLRRTAERVAPNPRETGTAGQILHGLFDVGTLALLGGPELVGISKTIEGSAEGVEQGLDPATALKKGAIEGATSGLGVAFPATIRPFVGSRIPGLVQQLGYGVAANVPLGVVQRELTHQVLADAGHTDMAEQYKALDEGALLTDFVMGMAFGGLGHVLQAKGERFPLIRPADVDAALTKGNAYHVEVDTAPGLARDPETRDAHVDSVMKATEDLLTGRPVDVSQTLKAADFEPNPDLDKTRERLANETAKISEPIMREAEASRALDEATAEQARMKEPDGETNKVAPPVASTPEAMRAGMAERRFSALPTQIDRLQDVVTRLEGEVAELRSSANKRIKGDDKVAKSTRNNARTMLQRQEAALESNKAELADARDMVATGRRPEVPDFEVEMALDAEAQKAGAIAPERTEKIGSALKAEGVEATPENVGTVDLIARARTADAAAVDALPESLNDEEFIAKLKEIAGDDQTTEAAGAPRKGAAGEGAGAAGGEAREGQEGGQAAGRGEGKPAAGGPGARVVEDAEIRGAEEVVAQNPDMPVTLEDGTTVSAKDALARADAVLAQAEVDAKGFEAAVMCATRRGG